MQSKGRKTQDKEKQREVVNIYR